MPYAMVDIEADGRETRHTHDPVDDARGNAEAMLKPRDLGLKITW